MIQLQDGAKVSQQQNQFGKVAALASCNTTHKHTGAQPPFEDHNAAPPFMGRVQFSWTQSLELGGGERCFYLKPQIPESPPIHRNDTLGDSHSSGNASQEYVAHPAWKS